MAEDALYNWLQSRSTGVQLPISSLPSFTGVGNFGSSAYRFVDFLKDSGMRVWQICPLGPTGYGDSPYQCFSAFAGNPYFIDLDPLESEGLLLSDERKSLQELSNEFVDYGTLYSSYWPLLTIAHQRFLASGKDSVSIYGSIRQFREQQSSWIEDYALFMALKSQYNGSCWLDWPTKYRNYNTAYNLERTQELEDAIDAQVFYQYLFYAQFERLHTYCKLNGVKIMGDIPIFVSLDSSDVWSNRELFQLTINGEPIAVAGVPPDYFSVDGQLWGNPLYNWPAHINSNFSWWLERIGNNLSFYDIVRLDHFRGFESYWSVSANESTARNGSWKKSPGIELFNAIHSKFPEAQIIAENLGVITEAVESLHLATGFPGMAVLQFAFDENSSNAYLPHNHTVNSVVYTGTHDNDTTVGWFSSLHESAKNQVRTYLKVTGETIAADLVRCALSSVGRLAIVPVQDIMSLGTEARLNTPGAASGNWQWRITNSQLEALQLESAQHLRELNMLSGRI